MGCIAIIGAVVSLLVFGPVGLIIYLILVLIFAVSALKK